jgi:hypothetical protein
MKTFIAIWVVLLVVGFCVLAYHSADTPTPQPDPMMVELSKITANTPEQLERMAWEFEQHGGKREDFAAYVKNLAREMNGARR